MQIKFYFKCKIDHIYLIYKDIIAYDIGILYDYTDSEV